MAQRVSAALSSGSCSRSHSLPRSGVTGSKTLLSYSPAVPVSMTSEVDSFADIKKKNAHKKSSHNQHEFQHLTERFQRASTGASIDAYHGQRLCGLSANEQRSASPELTNRLVAIFDYNARTDEEISLRKGDVMLVLNDSDSEWWFVEHCRTSAKGYVPSSYVAFEFSVEAEEWYVPKISRKDSERLLLLNSNNRGTFLIRESETTKGTLTLSVRDREVDSSLHATDTVKHYRVKHIDGGGFYITTKRGFPTLRDLVEHYSADANGLCCRLTRPCPRPPPLTTDLSVQTKDHWEVPRKSISLVEQLGSGQFGEVWKATWNGTTEVAVKMLKPGTMSTEEFLKEARIMKAARHPRLVRLYAVCIEDPILIITELMPHGSLLHYLRDGPGKNLTLRPLVDMMAQIASGMAYLERERYIHRDLAARNILVGENCCVKIADFGLARMVEDRYETYVAQKGTKFPIKWTAPEAALMGRFTIKSDVWSYGIVLYEIITHGQVPYPSMNNTETLNQVGNGYRMPQPATCPDPIYAIMLQTWDAVADKRPTFAYLCDFFEDYFASTETNYRHANISIEEPAVTAVRGRHGDVWTHNTAVSRSDNVITGPDEDEPVDAEDAEIMNLARNGLVQQHNAFEFRREMAMLTKQSQQQQQPPCSLADSGDHRRQLHHLPSKPLDNDPTPMAVI
ncbi:hypothetical protein AAHC03_022874 [Spirometra sp. Aus1]